MKLETLESLMLETKIKFLSTGGSSMDVQSSFTLMDQREETGLSGKPHDSFVKLPLS
jgi:hypothetical protein